MAIPPEFSGYQNEADFTRRFLIPLTRRLGFSIVLDYHGAREFGKDLILGEIDRVGHVRYHGLQAKFVDSISLNDAKGLILDCEQAFRHSFTHPQKAENAFISTFYAVNGGNISEQAREDFFAALRPQFGDNVKLIDGRGLVNLDRFASISHQQFLRERLLGIRAEIAYNRSKIPHFTANLQQLIASRSNGPILPGLLRDDACADYLACPISQDGESQGIIFDYSGAIRLINRGIDSLLGAMPTEDRMTVAKNLIEQFPHLYSAGTQVENAVDKVLADLGPLTGL